MEVSIIRDWLLSEAEENYKIFASSLLPNVDNILGVRLPKLRKKAKELAKFYTKDFIACYQCIYFEETLLKGFVIGNLNLPVDEQLLLVKNYVPYIDNWSVCDSFCVGLKFVEKNKNKVWSFLQTYLNSSDEFKLRFGVVMLLNYYISDEWINDVLDKLFTLSSDKYYAQMGIAWAISVCLMKYFDLTYNRLKSAKLSPVIFKKSIQKGCESYKLTKEQKLKLKALL